MDSKDIRALVMAKKVAGGSSGGGREDNDLDAYLNWTMKKLTSTITRVSDRVVFEAGGLIEEVNFPELTSGRSGLFTQSNHLVKLNVPKLTLVDDNFLYKCTALPFLDLPSVQMIKTKGFYQCVALKTIVLRNPAMVVLKNTDAFTNTPFTIARFGPGTLYVPQALIADYQANANWSTVLSSLEGNQILPIEGSTYE